MFPVRRFTDSEGQGWAVWLVNPQEADRRTSERRVMTASGYTGPERRSPGDRRISLTPRQTSLAREYDRGWLCFESDSGAKRRFLPVPEGWADSHESELRVVLSAAHDVVKCGAP